MPKSTAHLPPRCTPREALCISALGVTLHEVSVTLLSLGHRRAALLLACVAMTSAAPEKGGSTDPGNTSSASSRHLLAAARKPNVLLFVADDLGIGDIKASGYMDENGGSTTRVSTLITCLYNGPVLLSWRGLCAWCRGACNPATPTRPET